MRNVTFNFSTRQTTLSRVIDQGLNNHLYPVSSFPPQCAHDAHSSNFPGKPSPHLLHNGKTHSPAAVLRRRA